MSPTDQPIRYVIDSTALDVAVDISSQKTGINIQKSFRPWLTLCLEPISYTLLTFVLSLEPPGPEVMKSLLYQALQPSSDHPYGRRPDILRVDHSFSFAVLQRQGLFQQLQIAVERSPFQQQGTVERLFDELRLSLHEHFSAFYNRDAEKTGETPLGSLHHISLPQLDNVCSQWARLFSQPLQGRQPQLEFFDYCQTRWQLFPVDPHELALLLI